MGERGAGLEYDDLGRFVDGGGRGSAGAASSSGEFQTVRCLF